VKYQENQQVRTGSKTEYSAVHIEIVNIPLHSQEFDPSSNSHFPKQSDIFQCLPPYQNCQKKTKTNGQNLIKIYLNVSIFLPRSSLKNAWLRTIFFPNFRNSFLIPNQNLIKISSATSEKSFPPTTRPSYPHPTRGPRGPTCAAKRISRRTSPAWAAPASFPRPLPRPTSWCDTGCAGNGGPGKNGGFFLGKCGEKHGKYKVCLLENMDGKTNGLAKKWWPEKK